MSIFITLRRWERPDRPQPVYKGALTLWEAWVYPPIGDATRNSFRVPEAVNADERRALDVRFYDWAPAFGWITSALPAVTTTAQRWPAIHQATGLSYRALERPGLDVRSYEWTPAFSWPSRVVDAVVAKWAPVFDAELGYRSPDGRTLDVRGCEWSPESGWLFNAIPPVTTTAQLWPGILGNLPLSYRSDTRAPLDVRGSDWSAQDGWRQAALNAVVGSWSPAFDGTLRSYRPGDSARLAVTRVEQPAWLITTPQAPTFSRPPMLVNADVKAAALLVNSEAQGTATAIVNSDVKTAGTLLVNTDAV